MFSRKKKTKEKKSKSESKAEQSHTTAAAEECKELATQEQESTKLTTHQESKRETEDITTLVAKLDIPVSPYTTPYPFTECPPKILTAYASSVYNANEGRLLIIEMEKVSV